MKLLMLDTETGGLDEQETSLLSVGLVVWNNFKIENVFEIYIREPILRVRPDALAINKIDLRTFDQIAVPVDEAWKKIKQFIYQNFGLHRGNIRVAGMNVDFDMRFLKECFGKSNIDKWFSHRNYDLQSVIEYLYLTGKIDEECISSDKAYKYFNINNGVVEHMALKDCLHEIELHEKLLNILNL